MQRGSDVWRFVVQRCAYALNAGITERRCKVLSLRFCGRCLWSGSSSEMLEVGQFIHQEG